jgi:CheY-like chemotaxis protein
LTYGCREWTDWNYSDLAKADRRIPIVFITAQASDNERRQALAGGAVDLLLKPFSEDALFAAIQTALDR